MLYAAVILGLILVKVERCEIGRLIPVEVLAVQDMGTQLQISTDTGNIGVGCDFREAYANLRETASGYIYLDTVRWLLITGMDVLPADCMERYLKENIGVCVYEGEIDLKEVGVYLMTHRPKVRLNQMIDGILPQYIRREAGGYKLN